MSTSELRYELDVAARIYRIDVVDLSELADGPMLDRIRADGVIFYRRDDRRDGRGDDRGDDGPEVPT